MKAVAITAALCLSVEVLAQPRWTPHLTGVTARLRGLSVVSDRVIWASGTTGMVVRSGDGGDSWEIRPVPGAEHLDFRDVDAFNASTAYVLSIGNGDQSRIYKTIDGGKTWALQLANKDPKIFLDAMAFWSADRGLAFSDSVDGQFAIFETVNGGRTWDRIPPDRLPPALPNEGAYAASGTNVAVFGSDHAWIGTTASRVLHSADRGRTWTVAQTSLPTSASAGIFSIAFRDALNGIVVGGDYQKEDAAVDNAAVTSDGGTTWTLSKGLGGFRSAITFYKKTKGTWIAAGPRGIDITVDDGRTWKPIANGGGFHAFAFSPNNRRAWGTGDRGMVARLEGF